jgi:predicted dienelactone hydrolase
MSLIDLTKQSEYKAGYRVYKWADARRQRPVWVDLWYPANDQSDERRISYGLGHGSVAKDAGIAADRVSFPLVVISHGASGSAPNYGWLTEYLARKGMIVLGVSHYGESWRYGPDAVDPGAVTRLWTRPQDCTFALSQILQERLFKGRVDPTRIAAIGHSSGGATVIALGGATFDPVALRTYCQSEIARNDRGCQYGRELRELAPTPPEATKSYQDPRIKAVVVLDPAAGPGYSEASLAKVRVPVLVIGSEDNDFLPFEHHAGTICSPASKCVTYQAQWGRRAFCFPQLLHV